MRVKVKDVMTTHVASVNGNTPFKDVAEVLIAHSVSAVPVVDGEGHVIGVISEADLLRKEQFKEQYYREGYQPPLRARLRHRLTEKNHSVRDTAHGDTAAELMTSPAVTIPPGASVVSAIRLMDQHGVKRLPVVDADGVLVGVVSRQDMLRVFVRSDADLAKEVREDVVEHSLWAENSRIDVDVWQGVVTLTGWMARRSDAAIVVAMALRVHGVVDIVDKLEWEEDDTSRWGRK
ncbi:CBS domain-containing protein [Microtetraspora sp. AC03309]|uniref:CBS domain-containing protein n=1 Tax=Microtetraspora sp. AC03309 TaxID=2779376 RepID=UPI001E508A16|nr:CBS domain-containing protein [Microtetraspora sp. AC03309]MCC5579383.1 CBS domain-containing protein [Microtetraspora sp. AC03309]